MFLFFFISIAASQEIGAINYLGNGFDGYTGQYGLAPIFKWTYDNNQTWENYIVPDQMIVHTDASVIEKVFSGSYQSYQEFFNMFVQAYTFQVGIELGYIGGGLRYYKQLGYINDKIAQHYASVMQGDHTWTFFEGLIYPSNMLEYDPMFEKAIDMFPQTIQTQDDENMAFQFVQTFGTHYCSKAKFGAKVNFNTAITTDIENNYSKEWSVTQFSLYFHYLLYNISAGGYLNRSDIIVDQQFLQQSNAETFFYGGDPSLSNINNLTAWTQTIKQYVYPLNSTLNGLWFLVRDPIKQNTMFQYMAKYINGQSKRQNSNNCLGAGYDMTKLTGCLGQVYTPRQDSIFVTDMYNSQLSSFSVIMADSFDLVAWANYQTSESNFFGISTNTEKIYRYYTNYYLHSQSLAFTSLEIAYYRVTALDIPTVSLDPQFLESLRLLPPFSDTPNTLNAYFQFFTTYGNTVVNSVILGGKFETDMWYDSTLNSIYSYNDIEEYSGWSFAGIIGDGYGQINNTIYTNQEFDQNLIVSYEYSGGNTNYNSSSYLIWASTIKDNPQIIYYYVEPITNFIYDINKKNDVLKAYKYYSQNSQDQLDSYISKLT